MKKHHSSFHLGERWSRCQYWRKNHQKVLNIVEESHYSVTDTSLVLFSSARTGEILRGETPLLQVAFMRNKLTKDRNVSNQENIEG